MNRADLASRKNSKFGPDLVADACRIFRNLERNAVGCWEWQRGLSDGYGSTRVGSRLDGTDRTVRVHRWVYEALVGPIPEGLVIDHLCENRRCANPLHFSITTSELNLARQDYSKRRQATHCRKGHDLSDSWVGAKGRRYCKQCTMAAQQRRRAKRRAERALAA